MPFQSTIIFQMSTAPTDRAAATVHTGGWSETFWSGSPFDATSVFFQALLTARAAMLPKQASIVGYRFANFDFVGNKIYPLGSTTGRLQKAGNAGFETDIPQMALMLSGAASGAPNQSRFALKCIPDGQVLQGEYQPTTAFRAHVSNYALTVVNGAWRFIGRDLSQPSQRVQSIVGQVVTLSGLIGAVVGTDYMRLNRVHDTLGNPVTGTYRIVAHDGAGVYTVQGMPNVTVLNSGSARVDKITTYQYASVVPSRIVTRKVGRPSEAYRGRASKRSA